MQCKRTHFKSISARGKCVAEVYICATNSGVANMGQFVHLHDFANFFSKSNRHIFFAFTADAKTVKAVFTLYLLMQQM